MRDVLLVALGGAIGASVRYAVGRTAEVWLPAGFPWSTFAVNVIGCFAMGIVAGLADQSFLSANARLFLATGVLGGFTTFSAFGLEAQALLTQGRVLAAAGYAFGQLVLGVLAVFAGLSLVRH